MKRNTTCDICHSVGVNVSKYAPFVRLDDTINMCDICANSHIANVSRSPISYNGNIFPVMIMLAYGINSILKAIKNKK